MALYLKAVFTARIRHAAGVTNGCVYLRHKHELPEDAENCVNKSAHEIATYAAMNGWVAHYAAHAQDAIEVIPEAFLPEKYVMRDAARSLRCLSESKDTGWYSRFVNDWRALEDTWK